MEKACGKKNKNEVKWVAKKEGAYEMLIIIGSGVLILSSNLPGALPHARGEEWVKVTK